MFLRFAAGLLIIGWGNGCAVNEADIAWPQPRPLGADIRSFRPPAEPSTRAPQNPRDDAREGEGTLSLRSALSLALLHNPELEAFAQQVRAQEAQVLQSSVIPNPEVEAMVEDAIGAGPFADAQQLQLTVGLSQVIELGGKRAARLAAARSDRSTAGWDYEIKRLDVLTRVTKAFVEVLCAQEGVRLTQDVLELAQKTLKTFQEQEKVGKISALTVKRVDIAATKAGIGWARAQRRLEASRRALTLFWGNPSPRFKVATGTLGLDAPTLPSFEAVAARLAQNPDLLRWSAAVAASRAQVDLARSAAVPDLKVTAGYRYLNAASASTMIMGLSLPLPLFDRNQGAVLSARHQEAQARAEQRAVKQRMLSQLSESYSQLISAHQEARVLQLEVLPVARQSYTAVEEAYRIGRFGALEVLDSQRTYFEVLSEHQDALALFHQALADVEQLLGAPLFTPSSAPQGER